MTLSMSLLFRAIPLALLTCGATAAYAQSGPAATAAQPAPAAADDTRRLTDEERLAILDGNTVESAAAARGELPGAALATRGIHGEIGAMVGSHGTHAIYGTAEIPLGDRAAATISFENSRFGYRR